jgi:hypothetical protein
MDKREVKVSFGKAGNGIGAKISLPVPWLKKMGIFQEDRDVEMSYNEDTHQIIISKRK